jgi:hypothetical protein
MWSRFWDSFGETEHTETESQLSDPLSASISTSQHHQQSHHRPLSSPHQPRAKNAISPESNINEFPEITPNESASMVAHNDDNQSATSSHHKQQQHRQSSRTSHHTKAADDRVAFKYKLPNGQSHRFMLTEPTFQQVLDMVRPKLINDHMVANGKDDDDGSVDWLTISYVDDEDDQVLMTSDSDVRDAMQLARKMDLDRIMLFVVDRTAPTTSLLHGYSVDTSPNTPTPVEVVEPEVADVVVPVEEEEPVVPKRRNEKEGPADFAGIPQELILPAAITFLGVAILGVFAFSRMKPQYR